MDCVQCGLRPAFSLGHPDVRVCRGCELERHTTDLPPLDMAAFIHQSKWRTARSRDHQWTLRDLTSPGAHRSTCADHAGFEAAVRYIREHGRPGLWRGRKYVYWYDPSSGCRYWSMGADVRVTTIINRAPVNSHPPRATQGV